MSDNPDIRNLEQTLWNMERTLEKTNERLKRIESCLNTEGKVNLVAALHERVRLDMMETDKYQRRQLSKLRLLVSLALASSVLALIVSVIAVLR